MGSKINTSYWGANVNPATSGGYTLSYGRSSNTIRALIANGAYDPNTDSFDLSVSPWGIGYSAAGNRGQIVLLRNGTRDGAAPGVFTKIMFDGMDKENSNRPFALIDRNHYFRDSFRWLQSRVGGDITVDGENYMKNAAVAYGSEYLSQNSKTDGCLSLARVATYLDYQKYKLRVTGFIYINLDTGAVQGFDFLKATETVEQAKTRFQNFSFPAHMAIIGIRVDLMAYAGRNGSPTQWAQGPDVGDEGNAIQLRGHSIGSCINFNQITPTADDETKFKLCFTWNLGVYNNAYLKDSYATIPYRYWSTDTAAQCFPVEGMNYRTGGQPTYNRILVNGLGFSTDDQYRNTNMAGNFCDKEQSFGDITYKQRPLLYRVVNNQLTEVKEGDAVVYDTYNYYKLTSIYEVSGSDTFTKDQILALIKHEVAFYGFEFYICWGNAGGGTFEVGSDDLFLPKFDEHLITTGNYTSGTASLSEPNASWGNVFDDTMPEYDYEYNPSPQPGPGGGETPWDDNPITRIQEGYWTGFGGKTYISSMNSFSGALDSVKKRLDQNLNSFWDQAKDATDAYAADLDDESKRLKFLKGFEDLVNNNSVNNAIVSNSPNTSYTDCFLSCIRYPFDITNYFSRDGSDTGITWGRLYITSATDTWKVNGYQTGQIVQGGSLYVEKKYDNFLNYAPYTTAELYVPYCGSIPIDLEVFAGHTIDVKYLIDWFSGSCLALIYRDSVVVDQISGQIGTSVGIVAEDIQSYQNAMFSGSQTLKAQKAALRGSIVNGMGQSMDQISGAIGNIATAILGGEPSSSGSQSGGGAFASGFGIGNAIAQNYQNVKTAKYNLDHTYIDFKQLGSNGPSVGTWNEQVCRLVLYYPTFLPEYNPSEYGHTVGFACLFNKTLSSFSGLTVCSSVDTSGLTDATESEKTLIEDALKSGVYL